MENRAEGAGIAPPAEVQGRHAKRHEPMHGRPEQDAVALAHGGEGRRVRIPGQIHKDIELVGANVSRLVGK